MKEIQELSNEITQLTLTIEQEYPGLYQFLNENPITLPYVAQPNVDAKHLSEYLDSLKHLLKRHIESH